MKTIYILLSFLLPFSFYASAAGADKGHDIHIKIKGLPNDSLVRIGYYYGKARYISQDSARPDSKGEIRFKGDKTLPEGVYLCIWPKGYFEFLVSEQSFTLETDVTEPELDMKIKGSKENSYFYEFRKYTAVKGKIADSLSKLISKRKNKDSLKTLKDEMRVIDKDVDSFRKVFMAKYPNSFAVSLLKAVIDPVVPETPTLPDGKKDSTFPYRYYKAHYFDNINFSDERLSRTPFYEGKLEFYLKNMIVPAPDSIIRDVDNLIERSKASPGMFKYTLSWILNYYDKSEYMGMDAITSHLTEKYYLSGQATWATPNDISYMTKRDSIVSHLLIGKTAVDLYLTDSNGKVITLYSVNHKYTILYFWDATCGHCQKETPILHDFYEKNKSKLDLEIYAVTIERKSGQKDWRAYINEHHLGDWINVWDSFTYYNFNKTYDIYSTPVIYILNSGKQIIAKRVDVSQLQGFFDNLQKREEKKP